MITNKKIIRVMKKFIIIIWLFAMLIAPIQAGAVSELQIKEQYIQALTEV